MNTTLRTISRRGRLTAVAVALLATVASMFVAAAPAHAATVTIPNGTLFNDTAGNPMTAHGAGAIKVGNTYYLFGENRNANDTFQSIAIYKSTDLKNWQFDGDALNQSSAAELNLSNLERPKVLYNAATQKYVLYVHWEQNVADYTQARVAVATSSTINGPYTYHGSFRPLGYDSRDMTLFQDTDGTGYLVSSVNDNLDLIFMKLSADYRSVESVVANPWPGQRREAPAIFKRNGVYFAVTSGQDGWNYTQGKYATATNIAGPWTAMQNFGDNATFGSQSNYVLPVQGTSGTSYLYMGDRWAGNWGAPVDQSEYVWLPFTFPTSTTLTLSWSPFTSIDTSTGIINNVAGGPGTSNNAFKSIVGEQSQKCLDVDGNNRNLESTLVLWTCNSAKNQQYQVLQQADGSVNLITRHSHLCLDVQGNSSADGQAIIQYTCTGGANQRFTPELVNGEYYRLRIASSGKCVDVQGQSTANGTGLIQYTCNSGPNQKFRFP